MQAVAGTCTESAGPRNCTLLWSIGSVQLLLAVFSCVAVSLGHGFRHYIDGESPRARR